MSTNDITTPKTNDSTISTSNNTTTPKTNDSNTSKTNDTTASKTNDSNASKTNDSNAPTTNDSNASGVVIPVGYVPRSYSPRSYNISDNPISHYYEHGDRDNNSLKSYMWYSAGDDDGSDNDYVP